METRPKSSKGLCGLGLHGVRGERHIALCGTRQEGTGSAARIFQASTKERIR